MTFIHGILHWEMNFSRPVHDWELDSLPSFMDMIHSIPMRRNGDNKLYWKPIKRWGFEVKT